MNQSADLFLPGGLHRAMMSEQEFGFVFKLETVEVVCGGPERTDRQRGWIGTYSAKSCKTQVESLLNKRQKRVEMNQVKNSVLKSCAGTRMCAQGRFVAQKENGMVQELLHFT
ncbi:unnamed protein product [Peronospora belbahrii]|uniref:Uncharacterized protein n=1 Tax=Peronospora belbahrii TaxID=622444 RepID=A0AAU9KQ62_9STRA|nr:unnamed protein product [Peronospora belbahrii]